jgi:hypothetical protein
VTFASETGLPPPTSTYLRSLLAAGSLRYLDLVLALVKHLERATTAVDDRLDAIAAALSVSRPLNADEVLAHLRLAVISRSHKVPKVSQSALVALAAVADTSSWSTETCQNVLELARGAPEAAVQALTVRLARADDPQIKQEVGATAEVKPAALPVELWEGVESVLRMGPREDAVLLLSNLVRAASFHPSCRL